MLRIKRNTLVLLVATTAASAAVLASALLPVGAAGADTAPATAQTQSEWVASAPGQTEPKGGLVRVSPAATGRVLHVLVRNKDRVRAGDLLLQLDTEDLPARLEAAISEADAREHDRNLEKVVGTALERREAMDELYFAERALSHARNTLDQALTALASGTGSANDVEQARSALASAKEYADRLRITARTAQTKPKVPAYTRLEASLNAARAEVAAIDAAIARTKVRTPIDATVLQVAVKVGELTAPSPENPAVTLGDVTGLQVRAELDERSAGKIRNGQAAVVMSEAFPGQRFDAKITSISPSFSAPKLTSSGQRGRTDVDVLQVVLDLNGTPSLLPGARVDVFFKPDATADAK